MMAQTRWLLVGQSPSTVLYSGETREDKGKEEEDKEEQGKRTQLCTANVDS